MIVPTLSNGILLLLLGGVFVHFMIAGSRTFYFKDAEREPGALIGQISFLFSGTMVTWGLGLRLPIHAANQLGAALALVLSVALYEWARQAIWGRRFGLAWGDHVPETLCQEGPYRYIRHPIYMSYVLAFVAVLVALPHWITALAADYAAYRERTGMFVPRLSRAAPGKSTP